MMGLAATFWRSFSFALAGVLTAVAAAYAIGDNKTAMVTLVVGVIMAAVTGLAAVFTSLAGIARTTPLAKAIAQFAQQVAAGLPTVALAGLAVADFIGFGKAALGVFVSAILAGAITFFQNNSGG